MSRTPTIRTRFGHGWRRACSSTRLGRTYALCGQGSCRVCGRSSRWSTPIHTVCSARKSTGSTSRVLESGTIVIATTLTPGICPGHQRAGNCSARPKASLRKHLKEGPVRKVSCGLVFGGLPQVQAGWTGSGETAPDDIVPDAQGEGRKFDTCSGGTARRAASGVSRWYMATATPRWLLKKR